MANRGLIAAFLLVFFARLGVGQTSSLDPGEQILFYPSVARPIENGARCEATIEGIVFEPDSRRLALGLLRGTLNLGGADLTPAQERTLSHRGRLFMLDHKGRKRVVIRLGTETFDLGKSGADGRFSRTIRWRSPAEGAPAPASIEFHAVVPENDARVFSGRLLFAAPGGLVAISDIDDTIKQTGVGDRSAMLKSTFLEPFEPVPGMAELYRRLQGQGVLVHYLSASPWQLFTPLDEFLRANQFPSGVFHLKQFRWRDETFFSLFQNPTQYKTPIIERLVREAPDSRFLLVGDSGEKDPEIYAALARKHPRQIKRVFIRNTSAQPATSTRYVTLARGLAPGTIVVFDDPAEAIPWLEF